MSDQHHEPADGELHAPAPTSHRRTDARRIRRSRWRSAAPLTAMFALGAASGVGAYVITDFFRSGSVYCVVSPGTSELHDRSPGDLVGMDSGCSPGEIGPICGQAELDS